MMTDRDPINQALEELRKKEKFWQELNMTSLGKVTIRPDLAAAQARAFFDSNTVSRLEKTESWLHEISNPNTASVEVLRANDDLSEIEFKERLRTHGYRPANLQEVLALLFERQRPFSGGTSVHALDSEASRDDRSGAHHYMVIVGQSGGLSITGVRGSVMKSEIVPVVKIGS